MNSEAIILSVSTNTFEFPCWKKSPCSETQKVICVKTPNEVYNTMRKIKIDLFVLDTEIGDKSGFELCRDLRKETQAPIIFYTSDNRTESRIKGYKCGCDAYLNKSCDPCELYAIAERLIDREKRLYADVENKNIKSYGNLMLDTLDFKATLNNRKIELTKKEILLLLLLVRNENKIVSTSEIYKCIWGVDTPKDTCVIRTHISNLKNKIGTSTTDDYDIVSIRGVGYSFVTT